MLTPGGDNDNDTNIFQAMCLLMLADSELFSGIWNNLKNNTLLVTEKDPNTPTAAYDVLCGYKEPAPPHQTHAPPEEVTFVQHEDTCSKEVPGIDE